MADKQVYRFIGAYAEIGDKIRLERFGEKVEIPPSMAIGCPLLPEAEFASIGFTDDELARYAFVQSHADAGAEFNEKKRQAIVLWQERAGE